MVIKYYFVINL